LKCKSWLHYEQQLQPFSQKSRTPTVAKEFQIGLYDPAEAALELLNSYKILVTAGVRDFSENGCTIKELASELQQGTRHGATHGPPRSAGPKRCRKC